jgi:hypothetical protein
MEENVAKMENLSSDWHFTDSASPLVIGKELSKFSFGSFSLSRELTSFQRVIYVGICKNLSLRVNSPNELIEIDPQNETVTKTSTSKELRKRMALIEKVKLKDTKKLGIIFTHSLPTVDALFSHLKETALKKRKELFLITLLQATDETKFGNFGEIDAFVIVSACSCSALIQAVKTHVPLITVTEYEIALGLPRDYGGISWNAEPTQESDEESDDETSKQVLEYKTAMKGSWYGLQVDAGLHPVGQVHEGQKGIASGYNNEAEIDNQIVDF